MPTKHIVATFNVVLPIGQTNQVVLSQFRLADIALPVWLVTAMSDGHKDLKPTYPEMGAAMAAISTTINETDATATKVYIGYQLDRMGSTTRLAIAVATTGLVLPKNIKCVLYSTKSINFIAIMNTSALFAGSHTIQQADNNATVEEAVLAAYAVGLVDEQRLSAMVIPTDTIDETLKAADLAKYYLANPLANDET